MGVDDNLPTLKGGGFDENVGWGNHTITLSDDELLENIQSVQKKNQLPADHKIEKLNGKYCLTVEMETGTGKTYTYIKTMYELNKEYGWSKFIVVVPNVAIREGVMKSFQITQTHFAELYDGKKCRFFVYNSAKLADLDHFAADNGIHVMIINTQAFAARGADALRIGMVLDIFRSRKPIEVVAAVHPIVIIDEPQGVIGDAKKSNVTRESLNKFNPLFYVNYSATHREYFNRVYRLDAIDAYQQQLVKRITVKGISITGTSGTSGYLYLQKINTFKNKSPEATIEFESISAAGNIIRKTKNFRHGDNIYVYSGEVEAYKNGYLISEINALNGCVEFTNGTKIYEGECGGNANEDDLRRIQIRETIVSHLEKERTLYSKGIKCLSLFFIDEVAKYRGYKENGEEIIGQYAELFEKEYEKQVEILLSEYIPFDEEKSYRSYLGSFQGKINKIHAGYFSIDRKGRMVNSSVKRGENASEDISAYDLIMKNKEQLLSFDEPVRFIFSHSALKEGWDNPNVFQICTLRTGDAEIRKRQEIGRGLRLCVDQNGLRQDRELLDNDVHTVNALTVIANESYEQFAKALQNELEEVFQNRPRKITPDLFVDRIIVDQDKNEKIITQVDAARLFVKLEDAKLVRASQLTEIYLKLKHNDKVEKIAATVGEQYAPFAENIVELLDSVYNLKLPMPENARKNAKLLLDKDKFAGKEFKALWTKINAKTFYTVAFEDNELIEKCVRSVDKNLMVTQLQVKIDTGTLQTTDATFKTDQTSRENLNEPISNVTFDLTGEIAAKVNLTRKLVGLILQRIHPQTFDKFKANPEEFIANAAKLIDAEKAAVVIEHVTYNKMDEKWNAQNIFVDNEISGTYGQNVANARKHLYDKIRYDSTVEKTLAENMDANDMVELYVKLPSGFYIHTPMGKYNPDWAIVLKESNIKHIYFVAESKGDTLDMQLREVEKSKIECAKRHFEAISSGEVKYGVVDSFETLLKKLRA
jgi:type III restriction enzyme